jgi:chitosanase
MAFVKSPALSKLLVVLLSVLLVTASAFAGGTKRTIQQLTSIFENSTPVFQYTFVSNIGDGRGYTFGFVGFTSGTYSGTMFIEEYQRQRRGNSLVKFLPAFRNIDDGPHDSEGRNPSTQGLEDFPAAFVACGSDPAFVRAQRVLADRLSWNPARQVAQSLGARFPITQGQLYDAYVNHGESGIRKLIARTNRRCRGTPRSGVREKKWLAAFLQTRLRVLQADPTWMHAVDRIAVYQRLLDQRNYRLRLPFEVDCYGNHFRLE